MEGAYVIGALSGYGMMASNGAADLLADHIAERPLPRYAPAFRLDPLTRTPPTPRSSTTGGTPASPDALRIASRDTLAR